MPKYGFYEVTSIVKVDLEREGWDSGCDEAFGVADKVTKQDALADFNDIGSVMVSYHPITKEEFENRKLEFFTKQGGI